MATETARQDLRQLTDDELQRTADLLRNERDSNTRTVEQLKRQHDRLAGDVVTATKTLAEQQRALNGCFVHRDEAQQQRWDAEQAAVQLDRRLGHLKASIDKLKRPITAPRVASAVRQALRDLGVFDTGRDTTRLPDPDVEKALVEFVGDFVTVTGEELNVKRTRAALDYQEADAKVKLALDDATRREVEADSAAAVVQQATASLKALVADRTDVESSIDRVANLAEQYGNALKHAEAEIERRRKQQAVEAQAKERATRRAAEQGASGGGEKTPQTSG